MLLRTMWVCVVSLRTRKKANLHAWSWINTVMKPTIRLDPEPRWNNFSSTTTQLNAVPIFPPLSSKWRYFLYQNHVIISCFRRQSYCTDNQPNSLMLHINPGRQINRPSHYWSVMGSTPHVKAFYCSKPCSYEIRKVHLKTPNITPTHRLSTRHEASM